MYSKYDMSNILFFGGGGEEDILFSMHTYLLTIFSGIFILDYKEVEKIYI